MGGLRKDTRNQYLNDSPNFVVEMHEEQQPTPPLIMTAFELISFSQGLNLNSLFEKQMGFVKRETRFASKCSANEIASKLEQAAGSLGFDVKKQNYKNMLETCWLDGVSQVGMQREYIKRLVSCG